MNARSVLTATRFSGDADLSDFYPANFRIAHDATAIRNKGNRTRPHKAGALLRRVVGRRRYIRLAPYSGRRNCQPEDDNCACEKLRPMAKPPKSLQAITHMPIADPEALYGPGPNIPKHHSRGRDHKRKKYSHCSCRNPAVFLTRILVPDEAGYTCHCKAIE